MRPPVRDTCYFKSTDGHNNNWSFSTGQAGWASWQVAVRSWAVEQAVKQAGALPLQSLAAQPTPPPTSRCSAVRLNLNVAHAAAAAGGCVIVDATKRGKVRLGEGKRASAAEE